MSLPHFYSWNLKQNPTFCVLHVFSKCRWVALTISLKTLLLSVLLLLHTFRQLFLEEDPWPFHVSETLGREGRHSACYSILLWPTVCRSQWLAMTVRSPQASVLNTIYYVSEFLMLGFSGECPDWGFWSLSAVRGQETFPFCGLSISLLATQPLSMAHPLVSITRHLLHNLTSWWYLGLQRQVS